MPNTIDIWHDLTSVSRDLFKHIETRVQLQPSQDRGKSTGRGYSIRRIAPFERMRD
jgi:hypothetical protein